MVKITACVIVKNEETHIVRWLDTMRKITKDIVVVDTGSSDRTVELAKAGGARVYHFAWTEDFAAAKNHAIKQAKGDWILFLDADEYFSDASIKNVRKCIEQHHRNPKADALICKIVNIDEDDNDRVISEFYNLRIFRNVPWLRYQRKIHEMIVKETGSIQIVIISEGIEILHTGYTQSIIQGKLRRNLAILQQEIAQGGERSWHYRYLCDCYFGLKDYEKAAKYARLHIKYGERSLGKDNSICKRLIECLDSMRVEEAEFLAEVDAQIEAYPDDPELVWYKAEYLARQKRYAEAEKYFAEIFAAEARCKEDFDYATFNGRKPLIYARLAQIARVKGELQAAEECFREAVSRNPYSEPYFYQWYRMLQGKDPIEIIVALRAVYQTTERDLLFVYKMLQQFPFSKVHLYYQKQLQEKSGIKVLTTAAADLFAAQQYAQAAEALGEALEEEYARLMLCVILAQDTSKLSEAALLLPQRENRVLRSFFDETGALSPEEEMLRRALLRRLAACRKERGAVAALREKYLKARKAEASLDLVQSAANEKAGEEMTRLLEWIDRRQGDLNLLAVACSEAVLAQLRAFCPQARLRAAAQDELPEEKGAFDCVLLGGGLANDGDTARFLKKLQSNLKPEGMLLFTAENLTHWSVLQAILEGQNPFASAANSGAFFAFGEMMRFLQSADFSEVEIASEETPQTPQAEALREKLQRAGLLPDARFFYTLRWQVKASQMDEATKTLRGKLSPEVRQELVFCLRRVENDIDAAENCTAIRRICCEKSVDMPYLEALIDNSMVRKTKLLVQMATDFFQAGERRQAILLLIAAYKRKPEEAELVYALALLLDADGAREEAAKVLRQYKGDSALIAGLREDLGCGA